MKQFYVYILCDRPFGSLYVGVTSNLVKRVYQHKSKTIAGYTKAKNISKLVYFEIHDNGVSAILQEKKIKKWKRDWKFNLISRENPYWDDLNLNLNKKVTLP